MKFWHMVDLAYALVSGDHERLLGGPAHYYVDQVEIWGDPPPGISTYHLHDLRNQTALLAQRAPHLGYPVMLRLKFVEFHQKKIRHGKKVTYTGENVMQVTGTVMSIDGRTELGQTAIGIARDSIADRAVDVTVTTLDTNNEAVRVLDTEVASALLERVYGTEDWDNWMHNPY